MSATTALAIVMLLWSLIGVAAGKVMGRRGHGRFTWWLLGTVLGPLVVPLGLVALVESPRHGTASPRALTGAVPDRPGQRAEGPRRPPMAGCLLGRDDRHARLVAVALRGGPAPGPRTPRRGLTAGVAMVSR